MSKEKTVEIIVATHKPYEFPSSDIYRPIHVGKAIKENDFGLEGDDEGDNISFKNTSFCELTALYYAWKNPDKFTANYIGLVHYRRYFTGNGTLQLNNRKILAKAQILNYFSDFDCVLPVKRNYYIESVRMHYENGHNIEDLNKAEEIIHELYPDYSEFFTFVMSDRKLHLYNMFIMNKNDFNRYCDWLFDILFELEKRVDLTNYDSYQTRVFGFLSERLLNVWILKNELKTCHVKVSNVEGENLVKKGFGLLMRKFFKEPEFLK